MNKVILMGRLTRDPEISYSNRGDSQMAIARFSLAVDRRFKRDGEPDADFIDCTAFGRQAEFVEKYLHKGIKIVAVGRIQNNNYTNREGQKVYSFRVVVDEMEFAESKNASQSFEGGYQQGPVDRPDPESAADSGFMNIPKGIDDNLPFN